MWTADSLWPTACLWQNNLPSFETPYKYVWIRSHVIKHETSHHLVSLSPQLKHSPPPLTTWNRPQLNFLVASSTHTRPKEVTTGAKRQRVKSRPGPVRIQCCQVLRSIDGHIYLKPRPFWDHSRPPITKFSAAQDFKAQQHWNLILGEGSWFFSNSGLNFFMKNLTDFLNLAKFVSWHL